ncbi:hypothetical protein MUG87_15765 [Ectobacillus sp. JY-23]|uniref:hypothetical protein n=1 Tax=Ectobacillus sp. JY-23 TaxID=2933872 RepID=UPI001FF5C099|nr:hypothetical protein [Ectobacillus sp. JY-23]UOY91909.1 hypothetical protein MUG87_15765 [Ectobacillus sp. JY-23]
MRHLPGLLLYRDLVKRWALTYERVRELAESKGDFPKPYMFLYEENVPVYLEKEIVEYEKNHSELVCSSFRGRSIHILGPYFE